MGPIGDQLNIDTPELVAIEMPLAGVGSRFIAAMLDMLVLGAAFFFLGILAAFVLPALGAYGRKAAAWGVGVFLFILFSIFWGYFSLFETFNNGRTLGKSVARIRVIHHSGRGVNFVEALGRNLVRIVDFMPGFYGAGAVAIFASRRHQRLGDMVAGTLVVREREIDVPTWSESASRTFTVASPASIFPAAPGSLQTGLGLHSTQPQFSQEENGPWGGPAYLRVTLPAPLLAKLTPPDLAVLEGFFARRLDMDMRTRTSLAERLAAALCIKSGLTIPAETAVETFLEAVAHQFRDLGRMS